MSTFTVIVFEKRPRWAPELQRQFDDEDVRVRACNSTVDLERMQVGTDDVYAGARAGAPSGVCVGVLDFDAAPAECLQYLGRRIGRRLDCPSIVIGSPRTVALEWSVRELGAVEFVVDAISGERLARLCRRQWSQLQEKRTAAR